MNLEQNAATLRRLMLDGFGRGDLTVVDQVMSPEHAEHQAGMGADREAVKQHIQRVRAGFPDLDVGIEDVVTAGDRVVLRHRTSGTHLGPFMGHAPTGRRMTIEVIDICRFGADGLIAEHWGVGDTFGVLVELGLLPAPGRH